MVQAVKVCPKCKVRLLALREAQFYFQGQTARGWVCDHCNGLWPVAGEEISILAYNAKLRECFDADSRD